MDTEIYKTVLGQVFRHFFSLAAGALGVYGVNEAMQNQLVEASVFFAVALLFTVISQVWSILQKRYAHLLIEKARKSEAFTPLAEIKQLANRETKTPVSY